MNVKQSVALRRQWEECGRVWAARSSLLLAGPYAMPGAIRSILGLILQER